MAIQLSVNPNAVGQPQQAVDDAFAAAVGITTKIILDNSQSGTPKAVAVKMMYTGGGPKTFVENYMPRHELGIADISSLGIAVTSFEIKWKQVGATYWHTTGVSALPGSHFHVIGIAWDAHDCATLIAH